MRKAFTLLIPLSIILLSAVGCYTILKHPSVDENYASSDYQHNCVSCHPDYQNYPYGYFYGDYPNYWWSTPRWGHYYAYPWWWDYYWYDTNNDNGGDGGETQERPQGEKAVRRDALRPPYTTENVIPTFHRTEPPSSGTTQPSAGTKPSVPENKPDNTKKDDKKSDDKDTKKAERRGGGPR